MAPIAPSEHLFFLPLAPVHMNYEEAVAVVVVVMKAISVPIIMVNFYHIHCMSRSYKLVCVCVCVCIFLLHSLMMSVRLMSVTHICSMILICRTF